MDEIKYCKKCLMPSTRPGSIFSEQGICQACLNFEKRKKIDWDKRSNELDTICNKYRKSDGSYDCLIPVSGGKDSHRLVFEIKNKRKMNPLLVTVGDPFTKTIAGSNNLKNLNDTFSCDHIQFNLSSDIFRKATKLAFEDTGEPLKFIEVVIYTYPFKLAVDLNIDLVVFGENSAYEYGTTEQENPYANETIEKLFKNIDLDYWINHGFELNSLNSILPPNYNKPREFNPEVIFMSYFVPWSSTINFNIAKRYGFQDLTHEWIREGCIENFEQIDSVAYMIHLWLKYPKFGFQRTSDIVSRRIREGLIDKSEGKKLIFQNDSKIDQKALNDFINFLGYTRKQFWDITEKFWNTNLFEKKREQWVLKEDIQDKFKKV